MSDVSEGVCEAPTFMEWVRDRMVVPTYLEGGNNALNVCQQYHQVVRVGHCAGLSETHHSRNTSLATAPADSAVKPSRSHTRAQCAPVRPSWKVAGGVARPSTRVRGVIWGIGDKRIKRRLVKGQARHIMCARPAPPAVCPTAGARADRARPRAALRARRPRDRRAVARGPRRLHPYILAVN